MTSLFAFLLFPSWNDDIQISLHSLFPTRPSAGCLPLGCQERTFRWQNNGGVYAERNEECQDCVMFSLDDLR